MTARTYGAAYLFPARESALIIPNNILRIARAGSAARLSEGYYISEYSNRLYTGCAEANGTRFNYGCHRSPRERTGFTFTTFILVAFARIGWN